MRKNKEFKKFLLSLYKPVKVLTIFMLLSTVIFSACDFFKQILLKNIIDINFKDEPSKLYICLGLLLGFIILELIFYYSQNIIRTIKIYKKQPTFIAEKAFKIVTNNNDEYFTNNHSGKVCSAINEMISDVDALNQIMTTKFLHLIVSMVSNLIVLLSIDVYIFLAALVLFLGIIITRLLYFKKRFIPLTKKSQTANFEYSGILNDSILNFTSLKIYNAISIFSKNLKSKKKESVDYIVKAHKREFTFGAIANIVFILVFVALSVYAITLLQANLLSIGALVIFFTSMISIKNATTSFSWGVIDMSKILIRIQNSYNIINQEKITEDDDLPQIQIIDGKIHFDNLSFKYNKDYIFKNFSINIDKNEKIGIIGVSGSGKTTFTNLLFKFYKPQKGKIIIDGQDINKFSTKSLYNYLSYVPQETLLLHSTILDNLKLAKENASLEEVIEAAKKAEIHNFIMSLEDNYNTIVGERGIKLSGGQRQRIAIARIFLRNSKIIIFDEATSSLDNNTEFKIQENIIKSFKDQTIICIAHRLSTLKNMDKIFVIEKGKIIDSGAPNEIIPKYENPLSDTFN